MKYTKLFLGALLMASATVASAQNITNNFVLNLTQTEDRTFTGGFANAFGSATKGKTFLDIYSFSVVGLSDLSAALTSIAQVSKTNGLQDLDITTFGVYFGNTQVASGDVEFSGLLDVQTLDAANLAQGAYTLRIGGTVLGAGGSYGGNANISPVPEPETWGMTLSGLAAVGFLARRRKSQTQKSDAIAA